MNYFLLYISFFEKMKEKEEVKQLMEQMVIDPLQNFEHIYIM